MATLPKSVLGAARANQAEYLGLELKARHALDRQWDEAMLALLRELEAGPSDYRRAQLKFLELTLRASRTHTDAALRRTLIAGLKAGSNVGARHAGSELGAWLTHFGDEARALDLQAAAGIAKQAAVERFPASMKIWSKASARAIRSTITQGMLLRTPHEEVIASLTDKLSAERWRARRLLRTETSTAYHDAHLATLHQARDDYNLEEVQKTCIASFDFRTAQDSRPVHGQVRDLDDFFVDGRGRHYLSPPGRPNDREKQIAYFQT